jgi:hypothetical protein
LKRLQFKTILATAAVAMLSGFAVEAYEVVAWLEDWMVSASGMLVGVTLFIVGMISAGWLYRSDR